MAAAPLDRETIHQAVLRRRYRFTNHARKQQRLRGISTSDVFTVLLTGQIIEQYPNAKPYPECLMMAFVRTQQPLYVAVAYNAQREYIYIVTVHWLDPARWQDPWTRKQP
jgi:hypothetical protein